MEAAGTEAASPPPALPSASIVLTGGADAAGGGLAAAPGDAAPTAAPAPATETEVVSSQCCNLRRMTLAALGVPWCERRAFPTCSPRLFATPTPTPSPSAPFPCRWARRSPPRPQLIRTPHHLRLHTRDRHFPSPCRRCWLVKRSEPRCSPQPVGCVPGCPVSGPPYLATADVPRAVSWLFK